MGRLSDKVAMVVMERNDECAEYASRVLDARDEVASIATD
jgi:hypothetical protein